MDDYPKRNFSRGRSDYYRDGGSSSRSHYSDPSPNEHNPRNGGRSAQSHYSDPSPNEHNPRNGGRSAQSHYSDPSPNEHNPRNGSRSSQSHYSDPSPNEHNSRNGRDHSMYARGGGESSGGLYGGRDGRDISRGNHFASYRGENLNPRNLSRGGGGGGRDFLTRESNETHQNRGHYENYRGRGGRPPRTRSPQEMPETIKVEPLVPQKALLPGSSGTPGLELLGNYFKLKTEGFTMYHYDVKIQVNKGRLVDAYSTNYVKVLKSYMKKEKPKLAFVYDGLANLYAVEQFPQIRHFPFLMDDDGTEYLVSLEEVANVELGEVNRYYASSNLKDPKVKVSETVFTVYNLIFRNLFDEKYTQNAAKYYDLSQKRITNPKVKLFEFAPGFVASVRMALFGLALNLHYKLGVVIAERFTCLCEKSGKRCNQTLDRFVRAIVGRGPGDNDDVRLEELTEEQVKVASRMAKGFRFKTRHGAKPRDYIIKRIVINKPDDRSRNLCFDYTNRRTGKIIPNCTVEDYFLYELGIRTERYPLVVVQLKGRKEGHIPMELCHLLPDQFVQNYKYDKSVKAVLPQEASNEPRKYFKNVTERVEEIAAINPAFLRQFRIDLIAKPVQFPARVLKLPQVLRSDVIAQVKDQLWCLVNFDSTCTEYHLKKFANLFLRHAREKELFFGELPPSNVITIRNCTADEVKLKFNDFVNRTRPHFVLVVIPQSQQRSDLLLTDQLYNLSKYLTDVRHNIVCQDLAGDKVKRPPNGYFKKLLLSVNGKLGGKNDIVDCGQYIPTLPFKMANTMVVGIDVNHPGAMEKISASIAVAVGSTDRFMYNFSSCVRVQPKKCLELVVNLEEMMVELLKQYMKINGVYPKSLIIFRDGVSDGQMKIVLREEEPKIRNAIRGTGKDIKLSLIVVQKRHTTRFALKNEGSKPAPSSQRTFNVPPGTVVDTTIVEPTSSGMVFLNSHFSYLGTSSPTKYVRLTDDHHLSTDQLEMFCYFACRNYIATNDTLSIPTPVKYADKCAYQAKKHIEAFRLIPVLPDGSDKSNLFRDDDEESVMSDFGNRGQRPISKDLLNVLKEVVSVGEEMKNRMYYV